VKIEHCKTEDMIADFFTKPLQGRRFQVLRDLILNKRDSSTLQYMSVLGNSITGILLRLRQMNEYV
jgi:hypothetical protein